jgi:hypothetical protein
MGDTRLELYLDNNRVSEQELMQKGSNLDITILGGRASWWINSTIKDVKMTARVPDNKSFSATRIGIEIIDS